MRRTSEGADVPPQSALYTRVLRGTSPIVFISIAEVIGLRGRKNRVARDEGGDGEV